MRTKWCLSVYQEWCFWPESCFPNYSARPSSFYWFKVMMKSIRIMTRIMIMIMTGIMMRPRSWRNPTRSLLWCPGLPQHCLSQQRVRQDGPMVKKISKKAVNVNAQELLANTMMNAEGRSRRHAMMICGRHHFFGPSVELVVFSLKAFHQECNKIVSEKIDLTFSLV